MTKPCLTKAGKYIREARYGVRMTLVSLAKAIGVSRQCVNSWERGINIPNERRCYQLAQAIPSISVDRLTELLYSSSMPPEDSPSNYPILGAKLTLLDAYCSHIRKRFISSDNQFRKTVLSTLEQLAESETPLNE